MLRLGLFRAMASGGNRVIQIVGANGSGKSTAVRNLLDFHKAELVTTHTVEGRATPLGYTYRVSGWGRDLFVVGAYVYGTAGADTIKRLGVGPIFDMVRANAVAGRHVLYEGAFVMNHTRGPELARELRGFGVSFYVLLLTTPLEVCFQAIAKRREETEFKSPAAQRKNIEGNHVRAQNYANKMRLAGAHVWRVNRANVADSIEALLAGRAVILD